MLEIINGFGKKDFSNDDCFVAVFISHAALIENEPLIFGSDDLVTLSDLIQPIFRNQTLEKKLKLFFIDHLRILTEEKDKPEKNSLQLNFDLKSCKIPTGAEYLFSYPYLVERE